MDYTEVFIDALILLGVIVLSVLLLVGLVKLLFSKVELEQLKLYMEFLKWVVVSVSLVLIANIVDSMFKDREAGINEIKQYDKYVELVIANDRIGPKWRLAQYFSKVTASKKLRDRWEAYFVEVSNEYNDSLNLRQKVSDSITQLKSIAKNPSVDSSVNKKIILLQERLGNLNQELDTKVTLPQNRKANITEAVDWENKGFSYLFDKDIDKAIEAFSSAEDAYNSFHNVYEIKNLLIKNRDKLLSGGTPEWAAIYKKIWTDYRYKLSSGIVSKLALASN